MNLKEIKHVKNVDIDLKKTNKQKMKEVKKQLEKEVKKIVLLDIINLINEGKNLSQISKKLNISKQKLHYYTRRLKEKGLIRKIGYGVWETSKNSSKATLLKEVRAHAYIWRIKLPKIENWDKRINLLKKRNIDYILVGLGNTPRIILKDRKIWLGNKNIIIFDPFSFFGKTAIESRKLAVNQLLSILRAIEEKLNINLLFQGLYHFKPSRHHYSLIKNNLAIQCDKEGKKIICYEDGKSWFVIDNSYNLHEAETINKDTSLIDNLGIQNYLNSHKRTNYKVTPEIVLEMITEQSKVMNGIQSNQAIFAENMRSHIKAVQDLSKGVNELRRAIKGFHKKQRAKPSFQTRLSYFK